MKHQRTVLTTLIVALGLVMAQDQKPSKPLPDTQRASLAPASTGAGDDDDLSAIRAVGNSFLDAYRARDAAALGALFTENAEVVHDGRLAI